MVSSEVMLVMTVVVTVVARRKTCFPTADAVIATKAEPSEDAIGFLYLFLSCPIPLIHIVKVIAWYDTDFAKRYTIISWLAITISHHEIGFSMCSGVIRLCSGLFCMGLGVGVDNLRHHNNHPTARKCGRKRGGRGGKRTRGSPPTML